MINDTNQNQSGGDGSTNIQGTNIYIGISATEARQIALDVYNANITILSAEAARIAMSRAEELTDDFLKKVVERRPELLVKFNDPGIQMALLNAQKEYARTGDKNLENLLVNLLLDRANEPIRNLRQIAFEEAMSVLPKLTQKQLNILTLGLLINENWSRVNSVAALKWFLSQAVKFKAEIEFNSPDLLHLEFTGCAKLANSQNKGFIYHLTQYHCGLFAKGFSMEEFDAQVGNNPDYSRWLVPCPRSPDKFMMNAVSFHELEGIGEYSQEERLKLSKAFRMNLMSGTEVREYLCEIEPEFNFFFTAHQLSTYIYQLALTPVGVAIASANFTKTTGQYLSWPYSMRSI